MPAPTSGKFGVGLTASILHSHSIFGDGGDAGDVFGRYQFDGCVCTITTRIPASASLESDKPAILQFQETQPEILPASTVSPARVVSCILSVDRLAGRVVCIDRREVVASDMQASGLRSESSNLADFIGTEVKLVVLGGAQVSSTPQLMIL